MKKTAVVTGGSSGIGLCTARALKNAGCEVYEISRRQVEHINGIHHICGDVTDENGMREIMQRIYKDSGQIDILVTCAGYGISGATEFVKTEDAKQLMEVNLYGTVYSIQAVLGIMRAQNCGRIVCISSVAAPIAIPFQAWYSVSKAAVLSYCSALREEIKPFGISVCTVLPGDIRTGFTAARKKSQLGDDIYQGRICKSVAVMEHDELNGMSAESAGSFISGIAMKNSVKPYYVFGVRYKVAVILSRLLPVRLVGEIVGRIYG